MLVAIFLIPAPQKGKSRRLYYFWHPLRSVLMKKFDIPQTLSQISTRRMNHEYTNHTCLPPAKNISPPFLWEQQLQPTPSHTHRTRGRATTQQSRTNFSTTVPPENMTPHHAHSYPVFINKTTDKHSLDHDTAREDSTPSTQSPGVRR